MKNLKFENLIFLCGARDFHAMDWYKSAKEQVKDQEIIIVTDLIAGEGFTKIVNNNDRIYKLVILDNFLFNKQTSVGNLWRNILKLILLPIQICLLKFFAFRNPNSVYHAHSMYYLWLAWGAGIRYVGTPQGSDILLKLDRSIFFRLLSIKALKNAIAVTVDSEKMAQKIFSVSGVKALIVQNGIDINSLQTIKETNKDKGRTIPILSVRGFTELYQIDKIIESRNSSQKISTVPISFLYPFQDDLYKQIIYKDLMKFDMDIGRLERNDMYKKMLASILVISIPFSDSSPRSVYESIFCGCIVAISYNTYYNILPECMKKRILIVDLKEDLWLEKAYSKALELVKIKYVPSEEALNMFDQRKSFEKIKKLIFN